MIRLTPRVNNIVDRRFLLIPPFFAVTAGNLDGVASPRAVIRVGIGAEIPTAQAMGARIRGGLGVEFDR